ncbi:hypothetical protein DIE20_11325 [Burkholderia sp. Bp9131]|uniref:hypothetical protein n=1 Tax=Burkholderia sp. Bp9131 TaxID=2184571 RepID=UPI000F580692|nr:hypothetical protein [Burkholderia sp. Bp9131]RQR43462.1 hypothetical protein DIE20_11325 [Burkholderia sp. Bp9131]
MSKFQLKPRLAADESTPGNPIDFIAGAALVQSQAAKTRPEKPIRLNLDITPAVHRLLKLYALENGTSVSEVVRTLIDQLVRPEQQHQR